MFIKDVKPGQFFISVEGDIYLRMDPQGWQYQLPAKYPAMCVKCTSDDAKLFGLCLWNEWSEVHAIVNPEDL